MLALTCLFIYKPNTVARKNRQIKARVLLPYAVYSNDQIDLDGTVNKFKMDLEMVALLIRAGNRITPQLLEEYQIMAKLDLDVVQAWIDEAGDLSKKGAIDGVTKRFSAYLHENADAWAKADELKKARDKNRRANIYSAYSKLGRLIAPEKTVVMSVMLLSGVSPDEIEDETKLIEVEIERMITDQILGRKAGPTGGLGLGKTADGKPTAIHDDLQYVQTMVRKGNPDKQRPTPAADEEPSGK